MAYRRGLAFAKQENTLITAGIRRIAAAKGGESGDPSDTRGETNDASPSVRLPGAARSAVDCTVERVLHGPYDEVKSRNFRT